MSFIRKKEIPPGSGRWYGYEVETFRIDGKVRQKTIQYLGRIDTIPEATMADIKSRQNPKYAIRTHKDKSEIDISHKRDRVIWKKRAHPVRGGVDFAPIHNYVIGLARGEKRTSTELKRLVQVQFNASISHIVILNWLHKENLAFDRHGPHPLARKINGATNRGWTKSNSLYIPENISRTLYEGAIQSNTGIQLIDQLTEPILDRDFRLDIRQQAALYYIERFPKGYELTEIEARGLIKQAISFVRYSTQSSKFSSIDLYKNLGDSEDGSFTLLDKLADTKMFL